MPSNNILLDPLMEVALPPPISMFPQTIGWQVLLLIVVISGIYFIYKKINNWRRNQYRRDALKRLSALETHNKSQTILQLNSILKETASITFGEKKVASLYGDDWLGFLNKSSKNSFNFEGAKQWQKAIYDPQCSQNISDEMVKELIIISGLWIQQHEES